MSDNKKTSSPKSNQDQTICLQGMCTRMNSRITKFKCSKNKDKKQKKTNPLFTKYFLDEQTRA